jgi:hypothetical protein
MPNNYDSDEDSSSGDAPNDEDLKMQKLLADWDDKDSAGGEQYVDKDDDDEDEDAAAKREALRKAKVDDDDESEEDEDADDDEEEEEEEEDEEEENEEEEEEDEEEEEEEPELDEGSEKKEAPLKSSKKASADDDDEDDDGKKDEDIGDKLKKKPKTKKVKKKPKKITEVTEEDTEEDIEMKKLLSNWDQDMGTAEKDDDEEEEEEEDDEPEEREVILDDNVLDHIVLAAADLEKAMAEFKEQTGMDAVIAGTIKGLGIKCARVSFDDATYLEIIAPDPKAPGPIGELLKSKKITELTPFHYAIRTTKAEELKDEVSKFGYVPDHITMFGATKEGKPRKWEMLYLYGHKLGGICPFFINWANSDHPCATLPIVGKLKKLEIRAPSEDPVHQLYEHVGVRNIEVEEGKPKFSFSFKSPNGTVKFSTYAAVGFKFPGFEADVGAIPGDDGSQDAEVVFENPTMPELLPVSDMNYEDIPAIDM